MRAAILRTSPGNLEVADVEVADLLPNEVLVRTAAAGLCHSDLHMIKGDLPGALPCVLGHESAGTVEAVGADVEYVRPGDHVVACLSMPCGRCELCSEGRPHLCRDKPVRTRDDPPALSEQGQRVWQFSNVAGLAEHMLLPQQAVVRIDDDVPLDRAAVVGCAVTTGLGAIFRTARVPPGASVAVIGCGGVGLSAVQGARIAGAARIIGVDIAPAKLELARTLGATHVVDASTEDPVSAVVELTRGGVHYSFEALGLPRTAEQAFDMLRPAGTAVLIGVQPFGAKIELTGLSFLDERQVRGSLMGSNRFRTDIPFYLDLYQRGMLDLDRMISQRIPLDDVNAGYAAMEGGTVARSVVIFP